MKPPVIELDWHKAFDFGRLDEEGFKEDSVREALITPLLHALGYEDKNIERSKKLKAPYLQEGNKKRPIHTFPDYCLRIHDAYAFVLDAKSPKENLKDTKHINQVYSYAKHPEVRAAFFALCNGRRFVLYKDDPNKAILDFKVSSLHLYTRELVQYIGPSAFQLGTQPQVQLPAPPPTSYLDRKLPEPIKPRKQAAKRHFGVHGYFTRQSWNVVSHYIEHFSQPGDLILDPFGGSGVTAIEALMCDRKAIHIDINPLAVFMVEALVAPVDIEELEKAIARVLKRAEKAMPKSQKEIQAAIKEHAPNLNIPLPKNANVPTVADLFTKRQTAELAILRASIMKEINMRDSLLLAFSSTLNKTNLTYHNSKVRAENAGNSAPMIYYSYRIAKDPIFVPVLPTFELKAKRVVDAKKDIACKINENTHFNLRCVRNSAESLRRIVGRESVDYIYTDPPYGNKIPYLDLSAMWNAWLGFEVSEGDYDAEAIVGGSRNKSRTDYSDLIQNSISEMFRVLKYDRWMSFVFADKDPFYWHVILDSAQAAGFEYVGAVPQKNGQTSFKKRQHPATVLSGQLIVNFKKVRRPTTILRANLGTDIGQIVEQTIEGIVAKHNGATLEQINDEIIIKGLELGFLDLLKKEYDDLTPLLRERFDYNTETQCYFLPKGKKFHSRIDLNLRIRYYMIAYLRRCERERYDPDFDDVVQEIMPLLQNGKTPDEQTILHELELLATQTKNKCWRLRRGGQQRLDIEGINEGD